MPSPATVRILFVVALAGTAASGVLLPEIIEEIAARLDDFSDLVACSRTCRFLAESTAAALAVGRLFRDKRLCPDDLPALITRVCRSPSPQVEMLLQIEAEHDAVVGLVERLLLARTKTESELAATLSLLARTIGPVAAAAISGTVVPPRQLEDDEFSRLCSIRSLVEGLDFKSAPVFEIPPVILHKIEGFVENPAFEVIEPVPFGTESVPLQYAFPFSEVFPNNAELAKVLLVYREVCNVLGSRTVLRQLMQQGVRFDCAGFLMVVSVPPVVLAQIYPLLRKSSQSDWFAVVGKLIDRFDYGAVDCLFRIGDFVERLSAAPQAESRFLELCANAIKQRQHEVFSALIGHPLMARVINLRLANAVDPREGTLLHLAVRLNHSAMVSILLAFRNLQLTIRDAHDHTALHYAWRLKMRKMLLRNIYTRNLIDNEELPRLSLYNRFLIEHPF